MKRRRLTNELAAIHRCEHPHAAHVTRLALQLFDRLHKAVGLRPTDRRLLEAAARLHDIGYAAAPADHVNRSARIVTEEGLRGFTSAQRDVVVGLILLHSGKLDTRLADARVVGVANQKRLGRLGAILRVADGLDHGHIQDVVIAFMRLRNKVLHVTVCSDGYFGNVAWAEGKADLWRETVPVGLQLTQAPRAKNKGPFHHVVPKDADVIDAARRILALQYRIAVDNREGALLGTDPEPLHDLRVALRRFRTGLRFFRRVLAPTSAPALFSALARVTSRLGPIRDSQVWMTFLDEPERLARLMDDPAYRKAQQAENDRQLRALRTLLSGHAYGRIMTQMAYLVRVELPALQRTSESVPFRTFATKKLRRGYDHLCEDRIVVRKLSVEEAHALRKRCKRVRYRAEFTEMVLGPRVRQLGVRLKEATHALGDLHDMDVHLAEAAAAQPPVPAALVKDMIRIRRVALAQSVTAWRRVREKEFRQKVFRRLTKKRKRG